jgi:hypothetical protein
MSEEAILWIVLLVTFVFIVYFSYTYDIRRIQNDARRQGYQVTSIERSWNAPGSLTEKDDRHYLVTGTDQHHQPFSKYCKTRAFGDCYWKDA